MSRGGRGVTVHVIMLDRQAANLQPPDYKHSSPQAHSPPRQQFGVPGGAQAPQTLWHAPQSVTLVWTSIQAS